MAKKKIKLPKLENGGKYNWEVTPRMEDGGQLPEVKDGGWIKKAINPKHKGWEIVEGDSPEAGDGDEVSKELINASGNPTVNVDPAIPRSFYDPVTNSINASNQSEVLSEYPHAIQNQRGELTTQNELAIKPSMVSSPSVINAYYDRRGSEMDNINKNFDDINNQVFNKNTKSSTPFLNNDVRMHYVDQMQYALPGTAEWDAHQELEPIIRWQESRKSSENFGLSIPHLPVKKKLGGKVGSWKWEIIE